MKTSINNLFKAVSDCMNVCDVIITERNVKFTFKGYLSSNQIKKLNEMLEIDNYIIQTHNYEKMEIVFTYNSIFDKN